MSNTLVSTVQQGNMVANIYKVSGAIDYAVTVTLNGYEVDFREEFLTSDEAFDWAWTYVCANQEATQGAVELYRNDMSYTAHSLRFARYELAKAQSVYAVCSSLQSVVSLAHWEDECMYLAGVIIGGGYNE